MDEKFTTTLHAKNPPVKALLSVSGIASNSSVFVALAGYFKNYEGPFLMFVIGVARDYGFDGIDFDWEFLASPQDMSNLSHLLEELQVSLEMKHAALG
ncbi:hypothetical protein NL676_033078 [Syzygium grande]|nr:hypothetical protein NL676_033078 [Syzygium grande]